MWGRFIIVAVPVSLASFFALFSTPLQPSGIGVNRTMKVRIYDYSPTTQSMVLVSESAGQNFSYA